MHTAGEIIGAAPAVPAPLTGRTILATNTEIALAELLDGERETVDAFCETPFKEDPDDRPVPFHLPERHVAVLDAVTGELLGTMVWRTLPYGDTVASVAWNIGIRLLPAVRGHGLGATAGILLARYLFDTTDAHRIEANTEVANTAGWRGLEKAGFQREGTIRGAMLRAGQRRDMFLYSLLRTDLEPAP